MPGLKLPNEKKKITRKKVSNSKKATKRPKMDKISYIQNDKIVETPEKNENRENN